MLGKLEKPERFLNQEVWENSMVAYQLYWRDEKDKAHFIGLLSEKRRAPGRITPESILNWGRKAIGDHSNVRDIYFVRVKV